MCSLLGKKVVKRVTLLGIGGIIGQAEWRSYVGLIET